MVMPPSAPAMELCRENISARVMPKSAARAITRAGFAEKIPMSSPHFFFASVPKDMESYCICFFIWPSA